MILEADKRGGFFSGGHDALGRYTISHQDVPHRNWNAEVDSWITQLVERHGSRGAHGAHASYGHGAPYGGGYGHKTFYTSNSSSRAGATSTAAEDWLGRHPGAAVLAVARAFELQDDVATCDQPAGHFAREPVGLRSAENAAADRRPWRCCCEDQRPTMLRV